MRFEALVSSLVETGTALFKFGDQGSKCSSQFCCLRVRWQNSAIQVTLLSATGERWSGAPALASGRSVVRAGMSLPDAKCLARRNFTERFLKRQRR
jgi:hypothetical protein